MKIIRVETCPKCKKETLEVFSQVGSKILGEPKKCSHCGYAENPESNKSIGELMMGKNEDINPKVEKNEKKIAMTFFKFRENGKTTRVVPVKGIDDEKIAEELRELCKDESAKELNGDIFLEVPNDLDKLGISDELKKILEPYKNCRLYVKYSG